MQGDDLAILLFWLALFASFGLEAVKAETAIRRIFFAALATVFLLTGVFWLQIKEIWPPVTARLALVATNPVSWFAILMFIVAVFAFHRPKPKGTSPGTQKNVSSENRIHFAIRKSYVEMSGREFIGKSIIRCDAVATNGTPNYLDDCKFTAETEMNVYERSNVEFYGNLPPGGSARLHLFDLLVTNGGGEFLGYRFQDNGDFQKYSEIALIDLRFGSKEIGLLERSFHVRGIMESMEYVVASDDKEERDTIIESLTPDE